MAYAIHTVFGFVERKTLEWNTIANKYWHYHFTTFWIIMLEQQKFVVDPGHERERARKRETEREREKDTIQAEPEIRGTYWLYAAHSAHCVPVSCSVVDHSPRTTLSWMCWQLLLLFGCGDYISLSLNYMYTWQRFIFLDRTVSLTPY